MVMTEYNVCHIPDLLNHHGCDRVSVTDMTEIRGGKLHWATLTLIKEIGCSAPSVSKSWGYKASFSYFNQIDR